MGRVDAPGGRAGDDPRRRRRARRAAAARADPGGDRADPPGRRQAPVLAKAEEVGGPSDERGRPGEGRRRGTTCSPGAKYYEWERKGVPYPDRDRPQGPREGTARAGAAASCRRGRSGRQFLPGGRGAGGDSRRSWRRSRPSCGARARPAARRTPSGACLDHRRAGGDPRDAGAGFVYTGWSGDPAVEERVKERTKATIRVIPDEEFRSETAPPKCVSGEGASKHEVVWARAY